MRGRLLWPDSARALRGRDFRLYFVGQAVSLLGSWIQRVALSWLVYRLTGSATLLGVTSFLSLAPQLLVGPLAGAWVDRHDKKRSLIIVQSLLALQALVLAALAALDWIGPALLVMMSAILGVLGSFDGPLRHGLISAFVEDRSDLPNALALNAMLVNGTRFVGPPIAGFLLGLTSEAACFAINGLSFAALIGALLRARATAPLGAEGSIGDVFREGLHYVWNTWHVRLLIIALMAANLTASSYATLLPMLARDQFLGDARTLGLLWGAAGGGAFLATFVLARSSALPQLSRGVTVALALCALALGMVGIGKSMTTALFGLTLLGYGISFSNTGINILLQASAPESMRGRVVSYFMATRFGFDAIGGLIAGVVAAALGVRSTLTLEGAALALCAAWILARRHRLAAALPS